MQKIEIEPVMNGFIVTVGCKQIVFDSVKKMLSEIERYQKDPERVEKEYLSAALNKGPRRCLPPPGLGMVLNPQEEMARQQQMYAASQAQAQYSPYGGLGRP